MRGGTRRGRSACHKHGRCSGSCEDVSAVSDSLCAVFRQTTAVVSSQHGRCSPHAGTSCLPSDSLGAVFDEPPASVSGGDLSERRQATLATSRGNLASSRVSPSWARLAVNGLG